MAATVGSLLRAGIAVLRAADIPDPAGDARRLMAHALGVPVGRLMLAEPEAAAGDLDDLFSAHIAARARRQPVSQITGLRLFWGREFAVTPDVLDPRPETEILIAEALAGRFRRVLDLGTGSGCILVTLLAERPGAEGLGTDRSEAALAVARTNAARHGIAERASFASSDWLDGVVGRFDLIVSNPPYIAAAEMAGLEPEVRDWEPRLALTDDGDGLGAYRAILGAAKRVLEPEGRLLLEIGPIQASAIAAIGQANGWPQPIVHADLDGRDRVLAFSGAGHTV